MTMPDPVWFNVNPRRRHRVRPVSYAEILEGVSGDALEGCTRLAAIRRVAPLKLMTVYLVDCTPVDHAALDETTAYEFFEYALSQTPDHLEAQLRADAEGDWS